MIREINTIIIGGGISGLSSAHFLKKNNIDYILLESEKKWSKALKITGIDLTKFSSSFGRA